MMAVITNCYFDDPRTSAIACRKQRASCSTFIAPSDFFSCELFNVDAGRGAQIVRQIGFYKSAFATMRLRRGETRRRLFDNLMEIRMTKRQAAKLNVGDYVTWQEEMQFTTPQAISASTGEVIEKDYARFKVRWGDGVVAQYPMDGCSNIHRLT